MVGSGKSKYLTTTANAIIFSYEELPTSLVRCFDLRNPQIHIICDVLVIDEIR